MKVLRQLHGTQTKVHCQHVAKPFTLTATPIRRAQYRQWQCRLRIPKCRPLLSKLRSAGSQLEPRETEPKAPAPAPPEWKWEESDDAVIAYGGLFGTLLLGKLALAQSISWFDLPYFCSLACLTIYIGAHKSLTTDQRQQLSMKEGLLAPVAASAALFGTFLLIKYFPKLDLQSFLNAYFWLLGTFSMTLAGAPLLRKFYSQLGRKTIKLQLPAGLLTGEDGKPVTEVDFAPTDVVALATAVVLATAELRAGHMDFTLSNLVATLIATDILQLLGVRSFRIAGVMLLGLLAYDVFWVFGSSHVVGDNVMLTVATSDSLVVPTKLIFPRFSENPLAEAPDYPFSLLGLGDVALPGLLACLSLRYDASRSVDMRGRALAAATAISSAFQDMPRGSSGREMANAAAGAAEEAFDKFADREAAQRDSAAAGGAGPSTAARVPVSDAVLHQRVYFGPVMGAYVAGLLLAFGVNSVTNLGQPALLYLVPCTLGTVVAVAASRGDLARVWSFTDAESFGIPEPPGKERS